MKISCLYAAITLVTVALSGCTASSTKAQPNASVPTDASMPADTSVPRDDFELRGSWLYLGPGDVVHTLDISNTSIVYTGVDGADWSSTWAIKDYDNGLQHFQLVFKSGTGSYLPTGQSLSGAYDITGTLTVQLADGLGSYPALQSVGSCTVGASERIPNCGLYMKRN